MSHDHRATYLTHWMFFNTCSSTHFLEILTISILELLIERVSPHDTCSTAEMFERSNIAVQRRPLLPKLSMRKSHRNNNSHHNVPLPIIDNDVYNYQECIRIIYAIWQVALDGLGDY